jgi:glutamate N-acetyltransferase/amino-acid N-acetyltransferase
MSVTAARGFVASGVAAGLRPSGKPDVALVRSVPRSVGAAVWTTNRVQAAPVTVSKRHLEVAQPQAVLINAGSANAATGARGEADAVASAAALAAEAGLAPEEVLVLSTGVIGVPLPMDKMLAGARAAFAGLSEAGGEAAAGAILTTDSGPKLAVVRTAGFTVGGMAKGAGMIHPRLATMLVVITTDYPLAEGEPESFLRAAVAGSFNRISVDGDCSTNDAVVLLANGVSGAARDDDAFTGALDEVCADLARQIVADGEGISHVVELRIEGAANDPDALRVAKAIAHSPLVKTAWAGCDPNWGRLVAAIGYSGAEIDPERIDIWFGEQRICRDGGRAAEFDERAAHAYLRQEEFSISIDLHQGPGSCIFWTTDLTTEYVHINADYST